jgi:sulfur-carrier protein
VKVRVLFFAGLREQVGTGTLEVELPAGIGTVGALRAHLLEHGGSFQSALAERKLLRMAVNQEMVQPSAPIKGGDEIAFFPPVTGG